VKEGAEFREIGQENLSGVADEFDGVPLPARQPHRLSCFDCGPVFLQWDEHPSVQGPDVNKDIPIRVTGKKLGIASLSGLYIDNLFLEIRVIVQKTRTPASLLGERRGRPVPELENDQSAAEIEIGDGPTQAAAGPGETMVVAIKKPVGMRRTEPVGQTVGKAVYSECQEQDGG